MADNHWVPAETREARRRGEVKDMEASPNDLRAQLLAGVPGTPAECLGVGAGHLQYYLDLGYTLLADEAVLVNRTVTAGVLKANVTEVPAVTGTPRALVLCQWNVSGDPDDIWVTDFWRDIEELGVALVGSLVKLNWDVLGIDAGK